MAILTGLSGNEMDCLGLKGLEPNEIVLGNSVHSLGFMGGLGASLRVIATLGSRATISVLRPWVPKASELSNARRARWKSEVPVERS